MTTYRRGDYHAAEPTLGEWLIFLAMVLGAGGLLAGGIYAIVRLATGR